MEMKRMNRETIMGWIRSLAKRLVVLDVEGAENIPATGALLLTTSHISRLDTPFLMLSTERKDVIGVVAQEYQRAPFFGWVLNALRVIWISRGENDMDALREVMSFLSKGWVVGIAPEGRRSRSGQLEEGKPGAALIAERADVPIIAATVSGSDTMTRSLLRFRKMRVRVAFGKPYKLAIEDLEHHKERLQSATDEIMCQIAALMPAELRGYYAEYPRVGEILAGQNPQA